MNKFYLTPSEYAKVTGIPLNEVLARMRIHEIPYHWVDGRRLIPSTYVYPEIMTDQPDGIKPMQYKTQKGERAMKFKGIATMDVTLLTIAEYADETGLTDRTILEKMGKGQIPFVRFEGMLVIPTLPSDTRMYEFDDDYYSVLIPNGDDDLDFNLFTGEDLDSFNNSSDGEDKANSGDDSRSSITLDDDELENRIYKILSEDLYEDLRKRLRDDLRCDFHFEESMTCFDD